MKSKKRKMGTIIISINIIVILILWGTGIIGLWLNGMPYAAGNTKEFTDTSGHIIPGEYSISINLDDLQSNIGKELYNDGTCKIYVSYIDNTGSVNTGGYRIGFRSCGKYSPIKAVLVSGVRYTTALNDSFADCMIAKMTAKYNAKIYNSCVFSTGGLNHKSGDDFYFYVFPHEVYGNGEISLQEKGIAEITLSNLYKNIWTRK